MGTLPGTLCNETVSVVPKINGRYGVYCDKFCSSFFRNLDLKYKNKEVASCHPTGTCQINVNCMYELLHVNSKVHIVHFCHKQTCTLKNIYILLCLTNIEYSHKKVHLMYV